MIITTVIMATTMVYFDLSYLRHRLLTNKKFLILAGAVFMTIIATLAFFVLPLLGHAMDYIDKIGLTGLVERLWQGSGGGELTMML